MPREYDMPFEQILVSAAQDLCTILGPAGKAVLIKRVWVGASDTAIPTAQMLALRIRLATATLTVGSGGAAGVLKAKDQGDTAVTATGRTNDTVKATTSGAFAIIQEVGVHIYQGYDFTFPTDGRPTVLPAQGFVFELLSTVSGTVHLSGGVTIIEIG
jgi:hypothetical protein